MTASQLVRYFGLGWNSPYPLEESYLWPFHTHIQPHATAPQGFRDCLYGLQKNLKDFKSFYEFCRMDLPPVKWSVTVDIFRLDSAFFLFCLLSFVFVEIFVWVLNPHKRHCTTMNLFVQDVQDWLFILFKSLQIFFTSPGLSGMTFRQKVHFCVWLWLCWSAKTRCLGAPLLKYFCTSVREWHSADLVGLTLTSRQVYCAKVISHPGLCNTSKSSRGKNVFLKHNKFSQYVGVR